MISWDKVLSIAAVEVVGGTKAWVWLGVVETAGVVAQVNDDNISK